jgi:hypothetical protein
MDTTTHDHDQKEFANKNGEKENFNFSWIKFVFKPKEIQSDRGISSLRPSWIYKTDRSTSFLFFHGSIFRD